MWLRGFTVFVCLCYVVFAYGQGMQPTQVLAKSDQLLLVITKNWQSMHGELFRYARSSPNQSWHKVGATIPVVVGKNGLGWGVAARKLDLPGSVKKEGDNKAPAGVFPLGPAFGFAPKNLGFTPLNYVPLVAGTQCVDDPNSSYYNKIVNTAKTPVTWKSAEKMRQQPLYLWGLVVDYNQHNPVKGAGSCIFMHIWKNPDTGTAGCTAMPKKDVLQLLRWLDPAKKPKLVQLTQQAYEKLRQPWGLPSQ